jgi:RNA polymerase sigma-70 factor (ECF subfamily)
MLVARSVPAEFCSKEEDFASTWIFMLIFLILHDIYLVVYSFYVFCCTGAPEMQDLIDRDHRLEAALMLERPRLVGLCARLTGKSDSAEDLAQETLLEAWRHLGDLRDQQKFSPWLSGIARNVCLRWQQKQGKERMHTALPPQSPRASEEPAEQIADAFDLEIHLDRKELIEVLDRALALLPAETRSVLTWRYVLESPLAEVAALLGVPTSVAAMRLQRGKLALRRVLETTFEQDIADYHLGLSDAPGASGWQETRLWCTTCGQQHLKGTYDAAEGELRLTCPTCCPDQGNFLLHTHAISILGGVKGYKPAISRVYNWSHHYYRPHLLNPTIPCVTCGRPTILRKGPSDHPDLAPRYHQHHGLFHVCEYCSPARSYWASLEWLVLSLPEGRSFQQGNPRIRSLPAQEIERDGRPAIVTSYASVTSRERLVVVSARDTYEALHIERSWQ